MRLQHYQHCDCECVYVCYKDGRTSACLPARPYMHATTKHTFMSCHRNNPATPIAYILPHTATPCTHVYVHCHNLPQMLQIMQMPFELQYCQLVATALCCWTVRHSAALPLPLRFAATVLHCTSPNIALPTPRRCTHLQTKQHILAHRCAHKHAAQHMHKTLHAAHRYALTHLVTLNARSIYVSHRHRHTHIIHIGTHIYTSLQHTATCYSASALHCPCEALPLHFTAAYMHCNCTMLLCVALSLRFAATDVHCTADTTVLPTPLHKHTAQELQTLRHGQPHMQI